MWENNTILKITYGILLSYPVKVIQYGNTRLIFPVPRLVEFTIVWLRFPCPKRRKGVLMQDSDIKRLFCYWCLLWIIINYYLPASPRPIANPAFILCWYLFICWCPEPTIDNIWHQIFSVTSFEITFTSTSPNVRDIIYVCLRWKWKTIHHAVIPVLFIIICYCWKNNQN